MMSSDQPNPAEQIIGDASGVPSAEEVIRRLDRLWPDSRADPAGPLPDLIGHQVGRYTILRVIGRGAFGIVYQADDAALRRDVALKIPRPEVLVDADKRRRFEAEAMAAAGLDHPAIIPVYEADLTGSTPYIALAYVPGPDLGQWLANHPAEIPWEEAASFVIQLAEGVQYAHDQGVFHRDLKPSNVLLVAKGDLDQRPNSLRQFQPKLTDFGLAKFAQSTLEDTRSSLILGTPLYMAPELLVNPTSPNGRAPADVYSLGCLLYELLSGRPPIVGGSFIEVVDRLRDSPPIRLGTLRPDAPRSLDAICAKCLEKDPQARYASARALANDLNACVRQEPVAVRQATLWGRFRYWRTQPQRIRDAGWYSLCMQSLMATWLLVLAVALPQFPLLSHDQYLSTLLEIAQVLAIVHVPMIFVAWQTLRRRRWAVWAGVALSVNGVLGPLLHLAGVITIFGFVYRKAPYHAFAGNSLVCGAMIVQLTLYCFALLAQRKLAAAP